MCRGLMKHQDQEEIVEGIITYEEDGGYQFHQCYEKSIFIMVEKYHKIHHLFPEKVGRSKIIRVIEPSKRKNVRKIIRTLKQREAKKLVA